MILSSSQGDYVIKVKQETVFQNLPNIYIITRKNKNKSDPRWHCVSRCSPMVIIENHNSENNAAGHHHHYTVEVGTYTDEGYANESG